LFNLENTFFIFLSFSFIQCDNSDDVDDDDDDDVDDDDDDDDDVGQAPNLPSPWTSSYQPPVQQVIITHSMRLHSY